MGRWEKPLATLLFTVVAFFASPVPAKARPRKTAAGCAKPLPYSPLRDPSLELIFTPPDGVPSPGKSDQANQGHARWVSAIESAQDSVNMTMFHLTDPAVVNALIDAAGTIAKAHAGAGVEDLNVGVHVLLDHDFYVDRRNAATIAKLRSGGVQVRPASGTFSVTHEKSMVLDGKTAFVTAMNMTTNESWTRDFGVITRDGGVIGEMRTVFQSDWLNYQNEKPNQPITPPLTEGPLVWSPVNSESKLVQLIQSAEPGSELLCSTESLTDKAVETALLAATKCGVQVKFLAPQCDENASPALNLAPSATLNQKAGQTIAYVEPGTGSAAVPYIHSKMCLVNFDPATGKGGTAYVGSVNLSTSSMRTARELGIVFRNDAANSVIYSLFNQDLREAVSPTSPNECPPPTAPPPATAEPDKCAPGEMCGSVSTKQDVDDRRAPAEAAGFGAAGSAR